MLELAYLDSSVLLSLVFQDTMCGLAEKLFKKHRWVSSQLLEFECTNVLLRESAQQQKQEKLLEESLGVLTALLEFVNIIPIDRRILDKMTTDRRISKGRTLDAMHIASALHIQDNYEGALRIASFDKKFLAQAKVLGLQSV